jgi:hypothetical protein
MRVFDKDKTTELTEYDLNKGYLVGDSIFVAHHEAVEGVEEVWRYEVVREYGNGGKEVKKVIDVVGKPYKDAYDEYEDIQVYIPYTKEELAKNKTQAYHACVEEYIRERYSISAEIAIIRQRDDKAGEFAEYYAYAEDCKIRAKSRVEEVYGG